jgi:predicted amidohydrolase YtcJ
VTQTLSLVAVLFAGTFQTSLRSDGSADIVYHGGDIVTMDDKNPTADAVAVKGGIIIAVGKKDNVFKFKGNGTKVIDLAGKTLVPGFIDAHGHLMGVGLQRSVAKLFPPPDGKGDSIAGLQTLLKQWAANDAAKRIGGGRLIVGFGYDDTQLNERRHPMREELDAVSTDTPVIIIHQTGHFGVANTKALDMARISAETKDPSGGAIRREADGKTPNGVLEETAWFAVLFQVLPFISQGNERHFIEQGQQGYMEFGFTTAQEGRATSDNVKALADAALAGLLSIDVVAYPDAFLVKDLYETRWHGPDYKGRFRVGGIKVSLDGAPQGKTAWLTRPYKVPPPGQAKDYKGYATFRDGQLFPVIKKAIDKNWQVLAHCNGDAAADQFIAAIKQAETAKQVRATRPVMIHAQTVREDQLDAMEKYGIIPSFFSMHTYYWGDWHRDETLGEERAFRISPAASALKRKMVFTSHHDAPVALPDSIRILFSCVTRKSRSGAVIGREQRISMADALKAITIHAAYQYGEERRKGSIEVGKLADFVILSQNPITIEPDKIMDIKVLETIKQGKTVFNATAK